MKLFPVLPSLALALSLGVSALADDSATGAWKWKIDTGNGNTLEPKANLKQEGDKLTGTVSFRDEEATAVTDGKIKDGAVSFKVIRDRDGRKVTTSFTGQQTGDAIKGKMDSDWSGDVRSFDWNATRDAAKAAAPRLTGTWKWSIPGQNGETFETTLKLKQDGDKLSGTLTGRFGDAPIQDGKFEDNTVSFKAERERDGNKFTIKYKGKLTADTIQGQVTFNFTGDDNSRDWTAKRTGE
jgi:hypothetical protein